MVLSKIVNFETNEHFLLSEGRLFAWAVDISAGQHQQLERFLLKFKSGRLALFMLRWIYINNWILAARPFFGFT